MDTSALLIPSFNLYRQPATLKDADGNSTDCFAVIWDSNLGFGRNYSKPIQSDGVKEEKVSHHAVINVYPSAEHETIETSFNGSLETFRFTSDIVPVGNSAVSLWILKLNKV
jgi:hypothetical protein